MISTSNHNMQLSLWLPCNVVSQSDAARQRRSLARSHLLTLSVPPRGVAPRVSMRSFGEHTALSGGS